VEKFAEHIGLVSKIFSTIGKLEDGMLIDKELAAPEALSNNIAKMSVLLDAAVDPLFDAKLIYKQLKATKRDAFLAGGMKKSPAKDELEFDKELILMQNRIDRSEAHMDRVMQIIMTIQTKIKVQTGMAKGDL